jgi:hypothetical protein
LKELFSHHVGGGVCWHLHVIKHNQVSTTTSDLSRDANAFDRWTLSRATPGNIKGDSGPTLIIIPWSHVREPLKLLDTFLSKDGEVIRPLFTGRHNKDLFVDVIPQGPQHKSSSNPRLTQTTKRGDL